MSSEATISEVILTVLPKEPQLGSELGTINDRIAAGDARDVLLDFSRVEIVTSSSISSLMILHNMLSEHGRSLILFNVSLPTRGIFSVVGLREFFEFAGDKFDALAKLRTRTDTSKT